MKEITREMHLYVVVGNYTKEYWKLKKVYDSIRMTYLFIQWFKCVVFK